jgi:hypothetical protein
VPVVTAKVICVCVPHESSTHATDGPPHVPTVADSTVSYDVPVQVENVTVPLDGATHW